MDLTQIFGEGFDLAAVASGAGLFGGGAGTALALAVSGAIKRFILRTILTAVLTGAGFLALLHFLGFQIVPPEDLAQNWPFEQGLERGVIGPESVPVPPQGADGRTYYVRSPFRDRAEKPTASDN